MQALADALQPAITDLEVSWHLPDGYDVIQTPQLLPFVQNNKRLVIYGILYRPPGDEKESPRTPIKRKMDWSMRSFSNSSVKVFWFEDECDLLAEDQLLLEAEESLHLSGDDFEKDEIYRVEGELPMQDGFNAEMEPDTIEALADGLLKRMYKEFSQEKDDEADDGKGQSSDALQSNEQCGSCDAKEWDPTTGQPSNNPEQRERNNNALHSINHRPANMLLQDIASDGVLNDVQGREDIPENQEPADNSHEQQRSPKLARAYERDSGVGFSMEDSDKSPNESKNTIAELDGELEERDEEANAWFRNSSSPAMEEFDCSRKAAVHIYKNSEFLSQLGVPADFGAVNIKGFVGDEEMEQVIPFPVNRCGGSSKRPTIHQLLARSLIRELQSSVESRSAETIDVVKRISELSSVHSRHTALVARDQYCYDDQVLSALQFPQKENIPGFG